MSVEDSLAAAKIEELLDIWKDKLPPDVERFFSRGKAQLILRAAAWAYSVNADNMAGQYAVRQILEALGVREYTFSEDEAVLLRKFRESKKIRRSGEKMDLKESADADIVRAVPTE